MTLLLINDCDLLFGTDQDLASWKIAGYIIAALCTGYAFFHNPQATWGKVAGIVATILLIASVVIATKSDRKQNEKAKCESENKEIEYKTLLRKAENSIHKSNTLLVTTGTTLIKVKRNLEISDSVMNNTTTTIHDLGTLNRTAKSLTDSLKSQLAIQRETNAASQLLFKNMNEENELKLKNYGKRLFSSLRNIAVLRYPISFSSTAVTDSGASMEKLNQIASGILRLLNSEYDNPVLAQDSLMNKAWNDGQDELSNLQIYLSGYGGKPVQELRENLSQILIKFDSGIREAIRYDNMEKRIPKFH